MKDTVSLQDRMLKNPSRAVINPSPVPPSPPRKARTVWPWIMLFLFSIGVTVGGIGFLYVPHIKQWFFVRHALLTETSYQFPLHMTSLVKVRQDRFGSGAFGTKRAGGRSHRGIDLVAQMGEGVCAVKSGRVIRSEDQTGKMGHYIWIQHFDGTSTLYGHLADRFVHKGQLVRKGEIIGSVGKSGNAYNVKMLTHLHFEVWEADTPVDPLMFLSGEHKVHRQK